MGLRVTKLGQLKEGVVVLYHHHPGKPGVSEHRILGEPYMTADNDFVVDNVMIRGGYEHAHEPISLFETGVMYGMSNPHPRVDKHWLEIKDAFMDKSSPSVRVIPLGEDEYVFDRWLKQHEAYPLTLASEGASYHRKIERIMEIVEREYPKHAATFTPDMKKDLINAVGSIAHKWIVDAVVFGRAIKVLGMIGTEYALWNLNMLSIQPLISDSRDHRRLIEDATVKVQTILELERLKK